MSSLLLCGSVTLPTLLRPREKTHCVSVVQRNRTSGVRVCVENKELAH